MRTVFDECWQRWDGNPRNDVPPEERTWFKELNEAVFSGLEKKLAGRVKVYPVNMPAFLCAVPDGESYVSYVMTELVRLPEASFDDRVVAAIERLDALCHDSVVVFYRLLAPVCALDRRGTPDRLHLSVRMRNLPAGHSPV